MVDGRVPKREVRSSRSFEGEFVLNGGEVIAAEHSVTKGFAIALQNVRQV